MARPLLDGHPAEVGARNAVLAFGYNPSLSKALETDELEALADAGYFDAKELGKCEQNGIEAYVPEPERDGKEWRQLISWTGAALVIGAKGLGSFLAYQNTQDQERE